MPKAPNQKYKLFYILELLRPLQISFQEIPEPYQFLTILMFHI